MEFVASYWWLWILTLFVSVGYMVIHMFLKLTNNQNKPSAEETAILEIAQSLYKGLWKVALAQLVALASFILLVISIIFNVILFWR